MTLNLPTSEEWSERCANDGEFMMAARHWNGGIVLSAGETRLNVVVSGGQPGAGETSNNLISLSGDEAVWEKVLAQVPDRFHNDLMANISHDLGISRQADPVTYAQYFAAAARAIDRLRPRAERGELMSHDAKPSGTIDAPVGRYVHLDLAGHNHRIYFEEAGEGIPLLMQHTACLLYTSPSPRDS